MKNKTIRQTIKYAVAAMIVSFIATSGIAHATPLTAVKDTMNRLKIGGSPDVFSDHIFTFVLASGDDFDAAGGEDQINIDLPAGFVLSGTWLTTEFFFAATGGGGSYVIDSVVQGAAPQTPSCVGATGANKVRVAVETDTGLFRFRACPGTSFVAASATLTITMSGGSPNATIENPTVAGNYTIGLAHDDEGTTAKNSGAAGAIIIGDDQVAVLAEVDPVFTFNVGATTTACSTGFAGNGGTMAFGTVDFATIASSGTLAPSGSTREHICLRVSTNAGGGYQVAVKSLNNGLKSISSPSDVIASSTGTIDTTSVRYGICIGTVAGDKGRTVTTPDGTDPSAVSPYNVAACTATTSAGENVGLVDGTFRTIVSGTTAVANAFATVRAKIGNGGAGVPTHDDYNDTLTFIATGFY